MRRITRNERGARRIFLHIALVAGSILFSVPFIWLVSTSCKVADEMYPPHWIPQIPDAIIQSPYLRLRANETSDKPLRVSEDDWSRLAGPIRSAVTKQVLAMKADLPEFYGPYLETPILADGIFARILKRAPDDVFQKPEAEATAWFAERVDGEIVREVFDAAYRRVALSGVVFHGWDVSSEYPTAGDQLLWTVVDGDVTLVDRRTGLRRPAQELHYSFEKKSRFAAQAVFPLTIEPANLKKIVVSNHADRSWHRINAIVEMSGRKYEAGQPAFAGSDRWQDTTWQFQRPKRIQLALGLDAPSGLSPVLSVCGTTYRAVAPALLDGPIEEGGPWKRVSADGEPVRIETALRLVAADGTLSANPGAVKLALERIPAGGLNAFVFISGSAYAAAKPIPEPTADAPLTAWLERTDKDSTITMKTWLRLDEAGDSDFNEPGKLRLTIEYCQAGGLWATFNKYANNYRNVLRMVPLATYVKNSVFLVLLNICGQMLGSSLVAFSFSRLRWPARDFCFLLVLATLMIPPQVTMIPVFLIFKNLGWYNTLRPLWLPSFFGSAFYIFLLRQFMRGIPGDLEDSAKIDGCGYLGIYWRIIVPLVKPALAAIAIFTFMGCWNDFMGPLIYLNDQRLYPLSLGLFALQVFQFADYGLMMAASVLMTIPVILLFFAAQRQFIQGVTLTGIKG